ncbi:MAG: bifunctional acetaldehyde-CoA/alcohol dehydrogenase [Oscillospiraceae bacterium]|nr:bifunctional acetaldehyde-CoA/alcohol dehydrogenase [Oscillospiraceae bacterium]
MAENEKAKTNFNENEIDPQEMVNRLVANAKTALEEYKKLNQEQIDKITEAMALAGLSAQMELAKMAVDETKRGIFEDKVTKNIFSTEYIWHSIKHEKTVGIIEDNVDEGYLEIGEPVGIVAGVTPVTNPTSTTLFKSIICAKTRNPIIFGFHPNAQKCSVRAAEIVRDAAIAAGAPEYCVQWIDHPSIDATGCLMNHPDVATILATGGPGMVKAAYSAGKPALGVGPGNTPCYVEKAAKLKQAINDLILSKSFDNGMICASEQAAIIDSEIYDDAVAITKEQGCYFAKPEDVQKIQDVVINVEKMSVQPWVVGQYPWQIAEKAGISIPHSVKVLCVEIGGTNADKYPLALEKLSPVLAVVKADSTEQAFEMCEEMLKHGAGHTAVIHSADNSLIEKYGETMQASRIVVNSPASFGAIGDVYNSMSPSLTLGCGSYGKNSVSENVTAKNLINRKKVAKRRLNMQWFKVPEKIYFEPGSVQYLAKMPDIHRAMIVADPGMIQFGYVNRVTYQLGKNANTPVVEIFSDVEPDPDLTTVKKGVAIMNSFNPDVIIALGGGSAMDAAKAMWLFYENPDADFIGMAQKFMDIRKRVYKFPKMGKKAKMVSIPTTSGTGSEVTSFAVISDKSKNMKYPLADYELTPDVAIIDPEFVYTVPKASTAFTGLDVLTHAIEAYVSVLANDYTDALALHAIKLVFTYLPSSYKNADELSREKMHNASCIAGMAFTNAFLGVNHSLAHKLGGEFHIPHGLANAYLLPHTIEYNGEPTPTKFAAWPKYDHYIAPERYAEIAKMMGFVTQDAPAADGVKALADAVRKLMTELDVPLTIKEAGERDKRSYIDPNVYESSLEDLAYKAFNDQCTTANPRLPKIEELKHLYMLAYYGK